MNIHEKLRYAALKRNTAESHAPEIAGTLQQKAERSLLSLKPDGSWSDIDYTHQGSAIWKTLEHLKRLYHIACAFADDDCPLAGDDALKDATLSAFDYWIAGDFRNPNWWYNEIGAPTRVAQIMLLMREHLSPQQLVAGVLILERADPKRWTGQNLAWEARIQLARGSLLGDEHLMREAVELVEKEVRMSTAEGIQHDFSFHQHGAQLYAGGYGRGFSVDCAAMAAIVHNTPYQWSQETIDLLTAYLLDGQQWMVRGRTFDYSVCGRELVRPELNARPLTLACECLAEINPARAPEIHNFRARLEQQVPPGEGAPVGNRYFWRSEYMVHRRKNWSVSVRMASERLIGTESINRENLKGAALFDGVTYIMRSGEEYTHIFPVWDWLRVPGITLTQSDPPWPPHWRSRTRWSGGVSDGSAGMASFELARYTQTRPDSDEVDEENMLFAKKAWFFFDREIVVLGSGINTAFGAAPVFTSVNQCNLSGAARCSDASGQRTVSAGTEILQGPVSVWHDDIAYFFPKQRPPVMVSAEKQSGTWYELSKERSNELVTREIFSLWIDHGTKPRDADFCYMIIPDIASEEVETWKQTQMPQIVSNTTSLQAVWQSRDQTGMAAFHQPGMVHFGEHAVEVDTPCLLLLSVQKKFIRVVVSDPLAEGGAVGVKIHGVSSDDCDSCGDKQTYSFSIELPREPEYAGKPVIRDIAIQ